MAMQELTLPRNYQFSVTTRGRSRSTGALGSLVAHVGIILVLLLVARHDVARIFDAGDPFKAGGGGGGGGGGGPREVAYISLPASAAPAPRPAVTPPPVTPTPPPVQVPPTVPPEVPPVEPQVSAVEPVPLPTPDSTPPGNGTGGAGLGPGAGGGTGGGVGGGNGPGVGTGNGPGMGGGAGGQGRPPRLRQEVLAPGDAPRELRGREIRVVFTIDAAGVPKKVSFEPPLGGGKYAEKLRRAMLDFRFHPALGPDGRPVESTWVYRVLPF